MSPSKFSLPLRDDFSGFLRNQRGSISVITVVTLVPFMIAAGGAIDMGRANYTMGQMQKAVDSAALAAASTHTPVNVDGEELTGDDARIHAANMMVDANLGDRIASIAGDPQVTITGDVVVVDLSAEMPTTLMKLVGIDTMSLGASAAADWSKKGHGCIVALGANGSGIEVGGTVVLEVNDCWLHSNKEGEKAIDIYGKATIHAGGSCSVGSTSVTNNATTYKHRMSPCDPVPDPKADWTPPEDPLVCDHTDFEGGPGKDITLSPGKYCGGLHLSGYDNIHFAPGIYYIEGGALTINSKANVTGTDVGFYLAEDVPSMTINGSTSVSLSASDDGAMAGMLVAMAPPPAGTEPTDPISAKINGGTELNMTGTVYLPSASLDISGNSTTLSMATQILAHSVKMTGTSHLKFQEQLDEFGNPIGPEIIRIVKLIK